MNANIGIATAAANECIKDIQKTSYMIAAVEVTNSSGKKPIPRRWNSVFLVFSSFIVGTIIGGGTTKLHHDSFEAAFSPHDTFSDAGDAPATERRATSTISNGNGDTTKCNCDLTEEYISALCAGTPPAGPSITRVAETLPKLSLLANMTAAINKKVREDIEAERKALLPPLSHPSYCPKATCINTDLCSPCSRRFLIIVTTPRSASTTLTWMLDYLPGVRMAGENNNTLGFLKKATDNIVKNHNFRMQANTRTSWGHRFMPNQTLSCFNQKMIESISPPPMKKGGRLIARANSTQDIVGFKTIRFFRDSNNMLDQKDTVRYLKQNFPCSRVIVNINSDIEGQVKSIDNNFHSNRTSNATREYILEENEKLQWLARVLGPQRAFLIDKNEWTQNVSSLNEAVSWLGFDDACHFTELLEFNVKGGYGTGRTKISKRKTRGCKRI